MCVCVGGAVIGVVGAVVAVVGAVVRWRGDGWVMGAVVAVTGCAAACRQKLRARTCRGERGRVYKP